MKSAVSLLALAAGASAFTSTAPATKSSALSATVWDKYDGGFDFRMKEFKFDPVSIVVA